MCDVFPIVEELLILFNTVAESEKTVKFFSASLFPLGFEIYHW
jgi:hypothetical protein